MLHYRKTYEFAAQLWRAADQANNDRFRAFALGWMTHLATDVAGHCFVNEKCGGPYRLHWQRHHLVENHMDAQVYDSEYGAKQLYQALSCAALHLYVGFDANGGSHVSFFDWFDTQPNLQYGTKDDANTIAARKAIFDPAGVGEMPADLAAFLGQVLQDVYKDAPEDPQGQCAAHPNIISAIAPDHKSGFAEKDDILLTYKWLYRYMKLTTTDYFQIRRPAEPQVFEPPDSPAVPGLPELDLGLGPNNAKFWPNFLELLLAIFAWMIFLLQLAVLPVEELTKILLSAGTYSLRELLYRTVEIPLYNAWMALHWFLAMSGYTYPMPGEINASLNTLGVGTDHVFEALLAALADPAGGIGSHLPVPVGEPSGMPRPNSQDLPQQPNPLDLVADPQSAPVGIPGVFTFPLTTCGDSEAASEFHRPWLWPQADNEGDPVPVETPLTPPGPFHRADDSRILMAEAPGNSAARADFENARCEADTIHVAQQHLPAGEHLGDPVDYTAYVIAQLTRSQDANKPPQEIANFNLDSDRGYGYLCWDWLRSDTFKASPNAWANDPQNAKTAPVYPAPLRPGAGWCDQDLVETNSAIPLTGSQRRPARHDSARMNEPPVRIRYIGREDKYWSAPSAPGLYSFSDAEGQQLCIFAPGFTDDRQDHLLICRGTIGHLMFLDENDVSNTVVVGSQAVVGTGTSIYGFARGRYDHLQVHFWSGNGWEWRDQGAPDGTVADSSPAAITYNDGNVQRYYCFVCGLDGHLHINYWDGATWRWTDEGTPDGTTVYGRPAALAWQSGEVWNIYSFVLGRNGSLFVHYWNGAQWQWENAGAPSNVRLAGAPAAVTGAQRTQIFVRGSDGHLYVVELRVTWVGHRVTRSWIWTDLGMPQGGQVSTDPAAITYQDGNMQRTYVFVGCYKDGQLYVKYWSGLWQWAAQGLAGSAKVADAPGAVTYSDSGTQWIYAAVRGEDKQYYLNYWNGSKWQWTILPQPQAATTAGGG
jgi:hypothetical protein